jgi:hypothetical protein
MKRRDTIVEDLHKLRERIGRAHDFDIDRIAATIRKHEREAAPRNHDLGETPPKHETRRTRRRRRKAAQHRDGAVGA